MSENGAVSPRSVVLNQLDSFIIVKAFVMRVVMAAHAEFRSRLPGHMGVLWVFAMTATWAVAGLTTDAAAVFR